MAKYKSHTLKEYLDVLSKRTPVPGGGSVAALTGACGAALLAMVAHYSKGSSPYASIEKKTQRTIKLSEHIKKRLLELVDLDAQAYQAVVKARKASKEKKRAALKRAKDVPQEVCRLCYEALQLSPHLVKKGNKSLMSDVEIAVEMLFAAYNGALVLIKN